METTNSFDKMATEISDEERMRILDQMRSSESTTTAQFTPVEENLDDSLDPVEEKIKKSSLFLRFFIWFKALLSNTTQTAIYNEYRLSEIARHVQKSFPCIINYKQGLLLSSFYERLSELKSCADFFKPYLVSLEDNDGSFYVFLSSFIMPEVMEDLRMNAEPYSNPITPEIKPDTRSNLLRKLEEIFENLPADGKARMYQGAKATEWMKQFVRLPFARVLAQFSAVEGAETSCSFGMVDSELDSFAHVLCGTIDIPDEFLEALFMFAMRNSKHLNDEETGRDAGDFLGKAHSSLGLLQMFMTMIPIRSIGCLIHANSQWRTTPFSGGEDWFVKYKNTWKRLFDQKWASWESDCKKQAMLTTLKSNFDLDSFPKFPERPWEDIWDKGVSFMYDTTLGFLNWFMREKFSTCELDLKTLLVQGSFNKKENYTQLSDAFNAMIQLSISFQELERKLSQHGELGAMFNKVREDRSRTLQAQTKVEQMMREIESDVIALIHKFGDNARSILQVLSGILGLSKDTKFDTVSNLNKMTDKNNNPFITKIEEARAAIESALNFVTDLEQLDKKKRK